MKKTKIINLDKTKLKKGFTLVELIIVITILAILATIAFISFQGYTKNARDSNRTATISNLQKGLDIYSVQVGNLPEPDGTILSGSLNGVQLTRVGVIGDNISRLVKMNKTPTDPIGGNNYAYGISADNKYYQIGVTLENLESYNMITKTTYADNGSYRAKVVGNYKYPLKYNGKLYSLPSLLFTGTGGDLTQTGNAYFVINNGQNIPYHPAGTLSNTQTTQQVLQSITGTGNLVLTGITLPTETSEQFKTLTSTSTTIQNLQQALGITDQTQLGNVIYGSSYNTNTSVNATSGGSTTPAVGTFSLSSTTVTAGTNVTITNNCTTSPTSYTSSNTSVATISGTGITTLTAGTTNITPVGGSCSDSSAKTLTVTAPTWTQLDTNCTIPDITIGSQTWAGCNSTLGSGFERGKQDNGTNGTIGSCYDYNGNNTATCTIGSTAMASTTKANTWFTGTNTNSDSEVNNIWGKLYSWTGSTGLSANCKGGDFNASSSNSNCPCPTGRHVPTDAEFITLSTTLNGSLCETTTGWQCSGLGWMNNHTKTASNNIVQALKIPLAGSRSADGSTFHNRGLNTYLWSSSVSGTYAYYRYFHWSLDAVYRNALNQTNGFSVRCLKD